MQRGGCIVGALDKLAVDAKQKFRFSYVCMHRCIYTSMYIHIYIGIYIYIIICICMCNILLFQHRDCEQNRTLLLFLLFLG